MKSFFLPILVIFVGLLPNLFAGMTFDKSVSMKEQTAVQGYLNTVSDFINNDKFVDAFKAISSPQVVLDNRVMQARMTVTSPAEFAAVFTHYKALGSITVDMVSCTRPQKQKYEAHGTLKVAALAKPLQVTTTLTVDKPFGSGGVKVTSAQFSIYQ